MALFSQILPKHDEKISASYWPRAGGIVDCTRRVARYRWPTCLAREVLDAGDSGVARCANDATAAPAYAAPRRRRPECDCGRPLKCQSVPGWTGRDLAGPGGSGRAGRGAAVQRAHSPGRPFAKLVSAICSAARPALRPALRSRNSQSINHCPRESPSAGGAARQNAARHREASAFRPASPHQGCG